MNNSKKLKEYNDSISIFLEEPPVTFIKGIGGNVIKEMCKERLIS